MKTHKIILLSGGIDSSTLLAHVLTNRAIDDNIITLSFSYGQQHIKELQAAVKIADYYNVKHKIIPLRQLVGSPLTSGTSQHNLANWFVPGRNLLFLVLAAIEGFQHFTKANEKIELFIGATAEDLNGYADCRPDFFAYLQQTLQLAFDNKQIYIKAPLNASNKLEILQIAETFGVPLDHTWSCYLCGDLPCNTCDACKIRLKAFNELKKLKSD